ncbi:MAG TPA: hypothetical protein ENI18_09405 [Candidatus Aminicenantes bacterium]|nr:hypothetical protein [Candidatus Aminicenantes bacterium]
MSIISTILNQASFINFGLAILTYFSSILALLLAFTFPHNKNILRITISLLVFFSLVQILIGLFQLYRTFGFSMVNPFSITTAAGDFFTGFLGNSHLLALKLFFLATILTFLWWGTKKKKYLIYTIFVILGWLLASAIHSIILAIITIIFYTLLSNKLKRRKLKIFIYAFGAIIVIFTLTSVIQPGNIDYAKNQMSSLLNKDDSLRIRKLTGLKNTLFKLPQEKFYAPIIGVGLGSYSSRAAMITSGEYLRHHPSFIPIIPSKETKKFILPLWNRELLKNKWNHGVSNQPFSSWQSIYGEVGFIGLIIFLFVFFNNIKVFSFLLNNCKDKYICSIASGMLFFTIYLFFLLFMDNWLEYPRLMIPYWLITGLLLKEMASVKKKKNEKI